MLARCTASVCSRWAVTVAGWLMNEWQAKRIEFLCEQLKAYQRVAGTGRLPLTNEERTPFLRGNVHGDGVFSGLTDALRLRNWDPSVKPTRLLAWTQPT